MWVLPVASSSLLRVRRSAVLPVLLLMSTAVRLLLVLTTIRASCGPVVLSTARRLI